MALEFIFTVIYLLLALVAVYLAYSFYTFYKDLPIKTYLLLMGMAIITVLFSIIYPITYYVRVKIKVQGGYIYLLDTILVFLAISFFMVMIYVLERVEYEHITFRFVGFFGLSTAIFVAEFFEFEAWTFLISGSLEAVGFIYFLFSFGGYLLKLKPYVEDQEAFLSAIGGLILIGFSAFIGVMLAIISAFIKNIFVYAASEFASFPMLIGMLLIFYAVKRRPLSPLAILAEPISFIVIDRKAGKVIYSYFMQRSVKEGEEKLLRDLIEGVYLSVSEMFKEDVCFELRAIEGYTMHSSCGDLIMGIFVAKRSNAVIREMVDVLVKIFENEVVKHQLAGELDKINIEELARFDHIVKYYLTQVAR